MSVARLLKRWRDRAAELAPFAPAAAVAFQEAANDLEAWDIDTDASVSLKEAHEIGGYSVDHLQRLVSSEQLENVGRRGRPRIRRSDVPIKPGHQASLRNDDSVSQIKPSAVVAAAITRSAQ